jgi:hypothetical protein
VPPAGGILILSKEGIMRIPFLTVVIIAALSVVAAGAPPEGVIEGRLEPDDATATITALQAGSVVATAQAKGKAGAFRLTLAAGTYTILVSAPVSSFPIRLEDVVVKSGETTVLAPLLIMPGSGKAVLEGRVVPPSRDSEVRLLSEGKERAAARTDSSGRYEFRDLPAGAYEVRAAAPGYAADSAPVVIPENQRVRQTSVLLPVVDTDGVDWAAGKVRATGVGLPPKAAGNAAAARAMTERAAVAEAQRNLLRIIRQIKIDGERSVGALMQSRNGAERIQGYLQGYTIVSEKELGDGRIEVLLELPLTGPRGLSRYLVE